jgi:MFS family permease
MVVLDASVMNITRQSAQKARHFSDPGRQWIITAYPLSFGSLLLLFGRVGDLFRAQAHARCRPYRLQCASAIAHAASSLGVLVAAEAFRARSARCWPRLRWRCSLPRSQKQLSAATRSESPALEPVRVQRWACCWGAY